MRLIRRLILRLQCWRHGICYRHAEMKESGMYGWPYCQMCVNEGWERRKEYEHEKRSELIRRLKEIR